MIWTHVMGQRVRVRESGMTGTVVDTRPDNDYSKGRTHAVKLDGQDAISYYAPDELDAALSKVDLFQLMAKHRLVVAPEVIDDVVWVAGTIDRMQDYVDADGGILDLHLDVYATGSTPEEAILNAVK